MKMQSALHRTLQALLITGISIFVLAPAFAADPVKVTAANYVRSESEDRKKLLPEGGIKCGGHIRMTTIKTNSCDGDKRKIIKFS